MNNCAHSNVYCINHYEIIRKYGCADCGGVMMCECDEAFGRQFLSHQLDYATDLQTRQRIRVTLGFQSHLCNSCQGLPEDAHPKAQSYGRTSKLVRYYWREIIYGTYPRVQSWADNHSLGFLDVLRKHPDIYKALRQEAIQEIKERHKTSPIYIYSEESEHDFLSRLPIKVISLSGRFLHSESGRTLIVDGDSSETVEQYAASHFERQGYKVLFTESVPFHALFAVLMWLLIQDPTDPLLRLTMFGDRNSFDRREQNQTVNTFLPRDFGSAGYAARRSNAVEKHFSLFNGSHSDLLDAFDYWTEPSNELRQYLWAHRPQDLSRARMIASLLPVDVVIRILRYLVTNYWQRYLGWPDLFVYNGDDYLFAEVKVSKDKLSQQQRTWIEGNIAELGLPFQLVKIHKKEVAQPDTSP